MKPWKWRQAWRGLWLAALLLIRPAAAQDVPPEQTPAAVREVIPELEKLLAAAIENSPRLRVQEQAIAQARLKKNLTGAQWLEYLKFVGDVRYGTDDYVYLDRVFQSYDLFIKPYDMTRYSIGVALDLNLFNLTMRGKQKELAQTEIEMARERKEELLLEVKNLVITLYYELRLAQKNLEIMALQKASAVTQTEMAEIQFKRQQIDFIEYSKILEFHTKTLIDFEKATYEYLTRKRLLQELSGLSF